MVFSALLEFFIASIPGQEEHSEGEIDWGKPLRLKLKFSSSSSKLCREFCHPFQIVLQWCRFISASRYKHAAIHLCSCSLCPLTVDQAPDYNSLLEKYYY